MLKSLYRCVFVLRHGIPTQEVHGMVKGFVDLAVNMDAEIVHKEHWGMRQFAYRIRKSRHGYYFMLVLLCKSDVIDEIRRRCRLDEAVLRFLPLRDRHKNKNIQEAIDMAKIPSAMMQISQPD